MAECSTAELIAAACENQFSCLDEKVARAVMLQLLCDISQAPPGSAEWGAITGTLSDQLDLQAALDAKVSKSGDTMTGLLTIDRNGIGSTITDGLLLENATAAAAGVQQYSPANHFAGRGWKTDAVASSQTLEFRQYLKTVQDAANPRGEFILESQVNAAGWVDQFRVHNDTGVIFALGPYATLGQRTTLYNAAIQRTHTFITGGTADNALRAWNMNTTGYSAVVCNSDNESGELAMGMINSATTNPVHQRGPEASQVAYVQVSRNGPLSSPNITPFPGMVLSQFGSATGFSDRGYDRIHLWGGTNATCGDIDLFKLMDKDQSTLTRKDSALHIDAALGIQSLEANSFPAVTGTGTITVYANPTLTGSGSAFTTQCRIGDLINNSANITAAIVAIASATSLTAQPADGGFGIGTGAYTIQESPAVFRSLGTNVAGVNAKGHLFSIGSDGAGQRVVFANPNGSMHLYHASDANLFIYNAKNNTIPFLIDKAAANNSFALNSSGNTVLGGALVMNTAGAILSIKSGTGQRAGNATLVGGTVTVNNTTVTANTVIMLTRKTSGGTIGTAITYTVSAATSFTITSDNVLDTSTFSYLLIEVP